MKKNKAVAICFLSVVVYLFLSGCAVNNQLIQNRMSHTKSADGSRIAYGVSGRGETTLLFVHGWLGDHTLWQPQIDYFSNHYRVAWLDLAGHGNSKTNREKFTISAFAEDVKSVVDRVEGRKIILVGHSMGGPIILETARLLGDRVAGIVAVDSFYTPISSVPEKAKLAFLEKMKQDYPAALAETVNSMFVESSDPALRDATYKKMLAADREMGISSLYECIKWNAHQAPSELKFFQADFAISMEQPQAVHLSCTKTSF